MKLSRRAFEALVTEALDQLPERFGEALENLAVAVEDEPTDEDLASVGLDPEQETLFGLYHGVALPDRDSGYTALPDRVVVYRLPILEACESREEIVDEIRKTLFHEIGHYFGLLEDELPY